MKCSRVHCAVADTAHQLSPPCGGGLADSDKCICSLRLSVSCMPLWVCRWLMAAGKRPVPFRTRKLSPPALMVLLPGGSGRVGYRRRVKLDMLWHPPPHRDGPVWGLVWWRVLSRVRGVGSVDAARYWPWVMRAGLPAHVNSCAGDKGSHATRARSVRHFRAVAVLFTRVFL